MTEKVPNIKTQAHRCILANTCTLANTASCVKICPHLNALHSSAGRHTNAGLPSEYALTTLQNSPVRTEQTKIYDRLTKYVATFIRQFEATGDPLKDRIKDVYLWSVNSGTGKTSTAIALLNEFLIRHYIGSLQRGLTPDTKPAYFLALNSFQKDYNQFNRPRVPEETAASAATRYYNAMKTASTVKFLVLDDVAVREDITEAFRGDIHDIIDARVTNGLTTIYTSNLPMEDLPRVFGEQRLFDRIKDQCITMHFEGESRRGIRK